MSHKLTAQNSKFAVSVIVPVYNAEKTILTTGEALLSQTMDNIELIFIDDGSTDDTPRLLDELSLRDERVLVVHTENHGANEARELGLSLARGSYVGFCDADDMPLPGLYGSMYERALESGAEIVVCPYRRVRDGNVISTEMTGFLGADRPVEPGAGWLASVNTALWNKLILKDVLEKRIRFKTWPRVMEDALMLLSIYPYASRMSFLTEPLYDYMAPGESAMSKIYLSEMPELIDRWKELREHIQETNPGYLDLIDLAAFIHLRISAGVYLVDASVHDYERLNKQIVNLFPSITGSRYLTLSYVRRNRSLRLVRLASLLQKCHLLSPALALYDALTRRVGIDIKW